MEMEKRGGEEAVCLRTPNCSLDSDWRRGKVVTFTSSVDRFRHLPLRQKRVMASLTKTEKPPWRGVSLSVLSPCRCPPPNRRPYKHIHASTLPSPPSHFTASSNRRMDGMGAYMHLRPRTRCDICERCPLAQHSEILQSR